MKNKSIRDLVAKHTMFIFRDIHPVQACSLKTVPTHSPKPMRAASLPAHHPRSVT